MKKIVKPMAKEGRRYQYLQERFLLLSYGKIKEDTYLQIRHFTKDKNFESTLSASEKTKLILLHKV